MYFKTDDMKIRLTSWSQGVETGWWKGLKRQNKNIKFRFHFFMIPICSTNHQQPETACVIYAFRIYWLTKHAEPVLLADTQMTDSTFYLSSRHGFVLFLFTGQYFYLFLWLRVFRNSRKTILGEITSRQTHWTCFIWTEYLLTEMYLKLTLDILWWHNEIHLVTGNVLTGLKHSSINLHLWNTHRGLQQLNQKVHISVGISTCDKPAGWRLKRVPTLWRQIPLPPILNTWQVQM